ncbi:hypothetical protein B0181_11590 [Moraxella caviae]|uniref:Antitoxin HigA n=1 Tax=Moraxella caviae TaxID=34060 RepID=A0A1S9ZSX7_9GAMM|nr:helix-turn-helix transcriptional regulator [Moraxella caviae]OOR86634.1 hypothetical protein B0181_11590 [Moraxella caviae]STZ14519.1 Antitoxin HigA [Moraxella caviae]VEW11301.1 Antitoxin HigA [Moraxella caviae]
MKLTNFDDFFNNLPATRQTAINQRVADSLISIRLAELRKNAKLSQKELAQKIGVSQSAISQIESTNNLEFATLQKYISALGGKLHLSVEINGKHSVLL